MNEPVRPHRQERGGDGRRTRHRRGDRGAAAPARRARAVSLDVAEGCDVTDEAAVKAAYERIGEIDILVNNAGRAARKPAVDLQKSEWDAVLDLNLTATFLCSRLAHPYMKRRGGGAIVNLASIMGFSGGIFPNASYQASKGGVVNLTRALALEWAQDNIRVNAVAPTSCAPTSRCRFSAIRKCWRR